MQIFISNDLSKNMSIKMLYNNNNNNNNNNNKTFVNINSNNPR